MKAMQRNARGTYERECKLPGERRNAGECQGNVREWRQSARGMQGNAEKYREMPGERIEVGAMCQGNAGDCRGMPGERMGVGAN